MTRELTPPPAVAKRQANELPPEELQAECQRYVIPSGDVQTRMAALQLKYDEEYEVGQCEYQEFMKRLEEQKHREEFLGAVRDLKALEQAALAREPKIQTIVHQIQQNIAPKRLVVRGISPLACCALLRVMRTNTNVRALDLANNQLTDAIGGSLGKMVETNRSLRALDLGFNSLTHQTLGALGKALSVNAVLTSVVLESNPVLLSSRDPANSDSVHSTRNVEAFAAAVAATSSLTALNLFNTQMSVDAGRALAQAFAKNASIIALEVGGNTVHPSDVAHFASHLQHNQRRVGAADAKVAALQSDVHERAKAVAREQAAQAKSEEDLAWHDANAKARAEVREREDWERARLQAEADVQRLVEIEAMDKAYRARLDAEKMAKGSGAKGKKK